MGRACRRSRYREKGGTLFEYALLLGLILLAALLGVGTLSHSINGGFQGAVSRMAAKPDSTLTSGTQVVTLSGASNRPLPQNTNTAPTAPEIARFVSWVRSNVTVGSVGARFYDPDTQSRTLAAHSEKSWWMRFLPGKSFPRSTDSTHGIDIIRAQTKSGMTAPETRP